MIDYDMTHFEIGRVLGMSRSRVAEIEEHALTKLRITFRAKGLSMTDFDPERSAPNSVPMTQYLEVEE